MFPLSPLFTAGMMKQAHQEAQPEFQIQPDEFPALPGANKQSGALRLYDTTWQSRLNIDSCCRSNRVSRQL